MLVQLTVTSIQYRQDIVVQRNRETKMVTHPLFVRPQLCARFINCEESIPRIPHEKVMQR